MAEALLLSIAFLCIAYPVLLPLLILCGIFYLGQKIEKLVRRPQPPAVPTLDVDPFECSSCNRVARVTTTDGCCTHCGKPVPAA